MTRRVLIVGGNSEIAIAAASLFRADGGSVAGIGLTDDGAGSYDRFLVADCSDPDQAREAVRHVLEEFGGLETLILAAASMPIASAVDTTDDQWRRAIGATLDSAFYAARSTLPHMSDGAAIVAVSSINAVLAAPGLAAYSAAKAGVEGLMRQLALEYGPRGIRANSVSPATVNSRPHDAGGYPLGRTGHPDELARAIHFLGTDSSSFVTGTSLVVDGGLSISSPAAWLRPDLQERWRSGG